MCREVEVGGAYGLYNVKSLCEDQVPGYDALILVVSVFLIYFGGVYGKGNHNPIFMLLRDHHHYVIKLPIIGI